MNSPIENACLKRIDYKLDDVDDASQMQTTEVSKAIRAIDKDTVHKICSGQVVLSLAIAVKELVENSIDAGATIIEVKLKDQGLESLEVSDNGIGVEEHNLDGMTAKYHTSKIREFVDLQGVETFGFRGEALSSLCALSDMTIVTRHSSTKVAVRLELDHEGKIKHRSPCAGPVGTTVTLCNLFATLPVRKREFKRNIKKEFTKMCQILQAYGLVSRGIRIICANQNANSGRSVFIKTHGTQDVLENIASIFGSRQTADIIKIKAPTLGYGNNESMDKSDSKNLEAISEDDAISPGDLEIAAQFKLDGFISSCTHGAGRSSKDRQYFYINSRPCDPKNVVKLVNEVYHRYNMQQYPFIYLNIILKRSDVDVNLTPDKRQLLINNEKILLLVIKKALINTFGSIPAIYKMQNTKISSMLTEEKQQNVDKKKNSLQQQRQHLEENEVPKTSIKRFVDVLSQWKHTGDTGGVAPSVATTKRKCSDEIEVRTLKLKKIHEYLTREGVTSSEVAACSYVSDDEYDVDKKLPGELEQSTLDMKLLERESNEFDKMTHLNETTLVERIDCKVLTQAEPIDKMTHLNETTLVERIDCKVLTQAEPIIRQLKFKPASEILLTPTSQPSQSACSGTEDDEDATAFANSQSNIGKTILLDDSASDEETSLKSMLPCYEVCSSIAEIELSLQAEDNINIHRAQTKLDRLRFKSEISPSQNTSAEQELKKEISKDMFAKMDIIGQFNLGFIIVKLETDLFIVDQHATDEKYNFEMLQRTIVLHHQPLAVPQVLDMTAINEMILLDHLDVFEKNGFKFEINENAPPTKKIRLLGKPVSKNWQFGKDDIDELVFMLQDAPEGTICRPSRIRAMFASRACRKSVMIGRALNRATMKLLLQHMGEIEQPWNCPHGRPTMRHLINIAMLQDVDEKSTES